jgi:DDE superfamily endonuclease/Helix-turn-helix of DDE superfamily endonuclease
MLARLENLRQHPSVFRHLTGLTVALFDALAADVLPALALADRRRRDRPGRRRAPGAGHPCALGAADQVLLTVLWLRHYPTQEVLGFLFGVSDSAAKRALDRCLPVLEQAGKDTMRVPDPGRFRRKDLPRLLADTPGLAVIVDTFEQRVQRPQRRQRAHYSGKKKCHTLKSQLAVSEDGLVVHVADSVPGPRADLEVLDGSGLRGLLPTGVGILGDLAYVGLNNPRRRRRGTRRRRGARARRRRAQGATPRRKPRGQPRPLADRRYNRAFARRRIVVEHTIGRLRRFRSLAEVDRHHRRGHSARVRAVAGLVNRLLQQSNPRAD